MSAKEHKISDKCMRNEVYQERASIEMDGLCKPYQSKAYAWTRASTTCFNLEQIFYIPVMNWPPWSGVHHEAQYSIVQTKGWHYPIKICHKILFMWKISHWAIRKLLAFCKSAIFQTVNYSMDFVNTYQLAKSTCKLENMQLKKNSTKTSVDIVDCF